MAKLIYDYLHESILFNDENIENKFDNLSEDALEKELFNYRDYILRVKDNIRKESIASVKDTSVIPPMVNSKLISYETLRQCSLYIHRFIIDDPIFKIALSLEKSNTQMAMDKYLGMKTDRKIYRHELAMKLKYMKNLSYAIYSNYVKFIPGSLIHKSPSEIPIRYSESQFIEYTDDFIREYFYKNSRVLRAEKHNGSFIISNEEVKEPCRGIAIELKNHTFHIPYFYLLCEQKVKNFNEQTGKFTMMSYLPETKPSVEVFENWIFQSLNQVAYNLTNSIQKDILLCNHMNSIYFTNSEFVNGLLKSKKLNDDVLSNSSALDYALNFGVPVFEEVQLDDVLKIRNNYGESFEAFRKNLQNKTSELRYLKDDDAIKRKINDINYDFKEGYINNMKYDIKKFGGSILRNSSIIAGNLAWNLMTSDLNAFATFLAIQQGYATYKEYRNTLLYNPSYFLWKVNKNKMFFK